MTPFAAIGSVYRNYARFRGRARRSEFWWFMLFVTLLGIPASISTITDALWALGNFLPTLAVTARRLHDIGRSGWWQTSPLVGAAVMAMGAWTLSDTLTLGGVVAVIGLFILLAVFLARRGTRGPNRFGDDPVDRDEGIADVFS